MTWIDFAEVRSKVSLEDVLLKMYELGPKLKRQGTKLIGACPVHNGDGVRAFHAELSKNAWHCFSNAKCGGGNQLDFIAKKENVSVREAALRIHAFFHLAETAPPQTSTTRPAPTTHSSKEAPKPTAQPPQAAEDDAINPKLDLRLDLDPTHPHLLKDRGLSIETAMRFGIGYCGKGILRGTIAIPIHDEDGDLVAYAGRRLKWAQIQEHGKYKLPNGFRKEFVLYNLHRARAVAEQQGLVLVEGYFAAIKLHEFGIPNVVATMGCSLSGPQAELLSEYASDVTVLFDGGEAGRAGALAARNVLSDRVRTRIVWLPDGTQPDLLPPRLIRWALRGAKELDLSELSFSHSPPVAAEPK